MALIITTRITHDTVVLEMKGRLWVLDLPLRDRIQELLQQGCVFFILDIVDVDYIDSSGLGQLVSIWASVRKIGGNVVLFRPGPRVRRLLITACLQTIFDVFEDEDKAKAGVRRDWSPT